MTMHTARRALGALGTAAGAALLLALPAAADPPFAMSARVVDGTTDQVVASSIAEIEAAADRVVEETDFDLWTVYVDSFDGDNATEWANQTAIDSNADSDVLLLAIAVEDGEVGFSVAEDAPISDAAVSDVEAAARGEVGDEDWAGASLAAADAIIEEVTGAAPTAEDDGTDGESTTGGGALGWVVGGGAVVAAAVGVGVLARRRAARSDGGGTPQPSGPAGPEQQWAGVPTAELGTRAGSALVALDNDVRSSANELAFAEAQFGLEATQRFKAALDAAQQQLTQAFAIQQQLGDATPESEQQHRAGLIEILRLCGAADATLDSQTEAMGELRSLQDRAPQVLDELDQRASELAARVAPARDTLRQLGATYPATALATVSRAPDQADALLASARQSVAEGRARVQADDRGTAVAFARTAEDALQQVGTLLDMVANAGRTLADAGARLDGAIASLTGDVSDAGRLAPGDPTVAPAVDRAQAAIQAGTSAKGGGDPIAALAELAAAEQALDAALAPRREQEQVQARVTGQLTTQLAKADSLIRQTSDYIETNRGAVDAVARTRLATASESLARARSLQASNPQEALTAATSAIESANSAFQLAQNDVGRWRSRSSDGYGGSGIDAGSLILGGILGNLGDGGYGSSYGGGSSWGSSGGWGGSSSRGGSFGGGGGGGFGGGRRTGSITRGAGGTRRSSGGGSRRSSGGGRRR